MSQPRKHLKMYSSVQMGKRANLSLDRLSNELPDDPGDGLSFAVKNGIPHFYTSIDGGEPLWVPMGTKRNNKTLTFPDANTEITVQHNLGTVDVIAQFYDINNKLIDAPFSILSADEIKYTFTTAVSGKCVIFGASEKYAGFEPSVSQVTGETVSVGTGEPDGDTTSTLYVQVESVDSPA